MKTTITILFFSFSLSIFSQVDTILFLGVNDKVLDNIDDAIRYQKLEIIKDDTYNLIYFSKNDESWYETGRQVITKIDQDSYKLSWIDKDDGDDIYREVTDTNGLFLVIDYYEDNTVRQVGYSKLIFPLVKVNTWISYYKNGTKKSQDRYINNQLVGNLRWDKSGNEDISDVFPEADINPYYGKKGLNEFRIKLARKMRYPEQAAENNIQGIVLVEFIIMEDGSFEGPKIIESAHPILDKEAIRAIKSIPSKWTPGYIDNKPVRVSFTFPLNYMVN